MKLGFRPCVFGFTSENNCVLVTSIIFSFSGAFTNQIQAAFREPRLMIVADPRADHQPVTEGSYANIPVIAFANVDSPTKHIDVAIPCNNKSPHSIGLMWWFLAREVRTIEITML